jgi:MFS family permease
MGLWRAVGLVVTAPRFPGAMVFAVLFGLGAGLSSIVSGTLPLALFGPAGYGKRLGWISSAQLVISSFAPFAFALLASLTSYQLTIWALVGLGPRRRVICRYLDHDKFLAPNRRRGRDLESRPGASCRGELSDHIRAIACPGCFKSSFFAPAANSAFWRGTPIQIAWK